MVKVQSALAQTSPWHCHKSREAYRPVHHNKKFKVAKVKAGAKSMQIRLIGRIDSWGDHREREHNELIQKTNILRAGERKEEAASHYRTSAKTGGGKNGQGQKWILLLPQITRSKYSRAITPPLIFHAPPCNLLTCLY